MNRKTINIGIIGLGRIGKTHADAYRQIAEQMTDAPFKPVITAILRSHAGGDEEYLKTIGSPQVFSDPDEFFNQPLDLVDICTPNFQHLGQVEQALAHKFNVYCEKPLGLNLSEAARIASLANDAGVCTPRVFTHAAFVYRYLPAPQLMARLVAQGAVGIPNHFHTTMFHSSYLNPNRPGTWRTNKAASGGGALADLGIHLIDLVHNVLGEIDWVQCTTRTVIKERPKEEGSTERVKVDVDDWAVCTTGLRSGAIGTMEVSRLSGGRPDDGVFEVYGSTGSLETSFDNPRLVRYFNVAKGKWEALDAVEQGELGALKGEWQKCQSLRDFFVTSHLASIYDFLGCLVEGKESHLNFEVGFQNHEVLEAAYTSATYGGVKIEIPSCVGIV